MSTTTLETQARDVRSAQVILAAVGLFYAVAGLSLVAAPRWFYDTFATFPPFNRHYAGDAGVFSLAFGIGSLLAARSPHKHRLYVVVLILVSTMHALNHIYDAVHHGASLARWLTDSVPLVVIVLPLVMAYSQVANHDSRR